MSLEQKIPDSVIVIPRTHPLSWIMMFYALPKEMFENLPEYRQLPRNMRDIQVSEKYMRMINCDDFLIMIWSLYAWMVWHCLRVPGKNGEYRPISGAWGHYSEDFPIWRMTYEIGMHFREVFEHYSNWKVQRLFNLKKDEETPWLSLPDFCTIVKSMTQFVIDNMNLQPLIDDVALLIKLHKSLHQSACRFIPGKNEHAEGFAVFAVILRFLTRFGIAPAGVGQAAFSGDLQQFRVGQNRDLLVPAGGFGSRFCAGEASVSIRMVTCRANLVRKTLSSAAAKPPPATKTSLPVKNSPSQVAQ